MGAQNKLKTAMFEMDQDLIHESFLRNGCQWIPFKMNVPIPVIWEVAGNGWSAVYTMRWNHYCQRPGANSMMRLCVHSQQKLNALSTQDLSVLITYVTWRLQGH